MTKRFALALAGSLLMLPSAAMAGSYTAKFRLTEGGNLVSSGMSQVKDGKPVRISVYSDRHVGGPGGRSVRAGIDFRMAHRRVGDAMRVQIRVDRSEFLDASTGALKRERAVLSGDAVRVADGWAYETDMLPGGKVLKVTFQEMQAR